ncbi:MAG TPA: nitroreductase family protein [Firmicutes bacterium]|nr:nitroreductase family protein [Bacillota bacterium]
MNVIFNRKSIRKYTDDRVSEEQVELLLRAAMAAPSAGNKQPWEFIVIRNQELFAPMESSSLNRVPLKTANVSIVVLGNTNLEKHKGYWIEDCSAATQNILLQAEDLGLGAVWMGIYPVEDRVQALTKILDLPPHIQPLAIVAIGYPAEDRKASERFNPAKIYYERYKK